MANNIDNDMRYYGDPLAIIERRYHVSHHYNCPSYIQIGEMYVSRVTFQGPVYAYPVGLMPLSESCRVRQ
jgi:hypothetical protein